MSDQGIGTPAGNDASTTWRSYEAVALHVLREIRARFELADVQGKQDVPGRETGTTWEIDGKGLREGTDAFVIVECREYTKSRIAQEAVAAIAYRIQDTGADGAIIVTPIGLQAGAQKVADANNIETLQLNVGCTEEIWIAHFRDLIMIRQHDTVNVNISETLLFREFDEDGNLCQEINVLTDPPK